MQRTVLKKVTALRIDQIVVGSFLLLSVTPLVADMQGFSTYRVPKYIYFSSILLLVSLLYLLVRNQLKQLHYNLFSIAFASLLGIYGITQFFSYDKLMSFNSTFNRMEGFWYTVSIFLLYAIGSTSRITTKNWSLLFRTWAIVALLVTLGGFLFDKQNSAYYRLTATLGNPSYLAHYLYSSLLLLFLSIDDLNSLKKYYYVVIPFCLILLTGLFFTFARTTYLELIVSLIVYIIFQRKTLLAIRLKGKLFRFVAGISLVFFAVLFFYRNHLIYLLSHTNTINDRFRLWKIALLGIKEKPLVGWGSDNFIYLYDKYQRNTASTSPVLYDRGHNVFLDWFVHGGVVSGSCYVLLWLALLWCIRQTTLDSHKKALLMAWWSGSVIYLFFNIDNLINWLLLCIVSLYVLANCPPDHLFISTNRRVLRSLCVASALYTGCMTYFSLIPVVQSYLISRQFDTTDFKDRLTSLNKLSKRDSPADFTMAKPIYEYCYEVINSDLPETQKNNYISLAVNFLESQIKKRPPSIHLLSITADLYAQLHKTELAVTKYREIIRINPTIQLPYFQLGRLFFSLNDYQLAYTYFEEAERHVRIPGEATLMKISTKALVDSTYQFEQDLFSVPADERIKNAYMIGTIFRHAKKYTAYMNWIWNGGYHSDEGTTPLVLYEFATTAYTAGDMQTFKQVLTMYEVNYGCSPAFTTDILALVDKGMDPSSSLWTYKSYCKD
ncbi:O-antigen ligase family protein [Fibrella sp. ES10-3-2-2]|nr:hypothetical protein A6C57_16235 [Fibrella sp. ES10-3-2-2]